MGARLTMQVRGRVQGVFFRASTRERAAGLGLVGFVRNEPDGSVHVVAEGAPEALAALQAWIEAGGPPSARVDACDVTASAATGEHADFVVAR
ncbi:MAG: acylphosphatase [Myxococcales bacterium]|nr:acylphosphatase [Myxococcales bacterium]